MRSLSLCTLALVLALAGCDSAQPDEPAPAPVLPLAVGTEWTLATTTSVRFDETGAPADTLRAGVNTNERVVTLAVTRDTVFADETWYLVEPSQGLNHCVFGRAAWYANREDGLYRRFSDTEPELAYAIGLEPNDVFLDTETVEARYLGEGTVESEPGVATARAYQRLWKRLELNTEVRGPIAPRPVSYDALSPDRGPLVLEISYVAPSDEAAGETEGSYRPVSLVRYELVTPTESTARARAEAEAPAGIAVR